MLSNNFEVSKNMAYVNNLQMLSIYTAILWATKPLKRVDCNTKSVDQKDKIHEHFVRIAKSFGTK